jgi:predicted nucleotidyltransferase
MTREDVLQALSQFREERQEEFGITRIGVFGSVARGQFSDSSDVDVVVELAKPDLLVLVGIKQELEDLLHCSVDIVRYRETMNNFLRQRIDQEAVYV